MQLMDGGADKHISAETLLRLTAVTHSNTQEKAVATALGGFSLLPIL